MKDLATFKIFNDRSSAEDFAEILKENNIYFQIEEDALVFDASYANNPLNKDFRVRIAPNEFNMANHAYEQYFNHQLTTIDPNYYLFEFSDEELKEIVTKPDEWGSLDYALSQKILKYRGIEVTDIEKAAIQSKRLKELAIPEKESVSNIVSYYIISFICFPVGIVIGWIWAYSKKQLPNGAKVPAYNERTQAHGLIIFYICLSLLFFSILFALRNSFLIMQE
jgi:hypothetical protein